VYSTNTVFHEKRDGYPSDIIVQQISSAASMETPLLTLVLNPLRGSVRTNKQLIVSTYHMPCKFMESYLMLAHIHAVRNRLKELYDLRQKEHPSYTTSVILAGDFNTVPTSQEYRLLSGQCCTEEESSVISEMIESYKKIDMDLTTGITNRSTFKSHVGKEPEYTNIGPSFIDTIDYIFVSDCVNVLSSLVGLKRDNPGKTSYPNGTCPSDHLPLSASLIIK
jgi:mRNA deadenylase 3'-5' endonuclease subunit Ccr4